MSWNIANSMRDFFQRFANVNPKIVALFGAETCYPCHAARDWWMINGTPANLPFVYWEDKNKLNPEEDEAGRVGVGMYSATHPEEKHAAYPFCAIVEGARNGRPFTEIVKWSGKGYDECTVGLQTALAKLR